MNAITVFFPRLDQFGRLLLVFLCCITFSCKEIEEPLHLPQPGGEWLIFQLANFHVPKINSDETNFHGTIGGHPIVLWRMPGDNLIFIIPDIGEGPAQLKVQIGNQQRVWNLELRDMTHNTEENITLKNFIDSNIKLLEAIRTRDEFKNLAEDYAKWYEFFVQKLSLLTSEEVHFLNGILNFYSQDELFYNLRASFELSCINGPGSDLQFITSKLSYRGSSHLYYYSYLPSSPFHQAVLAGLGLGIWLEYVLMEYYADQTLKCPILRNIEFIELNSKNTLSEEKENILEAGENVSISFIGVFKPLSLADISDPDIHIFRFMEAFSQKNQLSVEFAALIHHYRQSYHKDLPKLPPIPLIKPSNVTVINRGPLINLYYPMRVVIDNPAVRMVDLIIDSETMSFRLESLNGQPQLFNLLCAIIAWESNYITELPILLNTSCPVLVDVLLVGREHIADVRFAQEPYQIRWSNGMIGDRVNNLSPGNYGLSFTDANGCGKEIEFILPEFDKMEDIEGNSYETVKIGNTWWMAENLRTSKLSDGTDIQHITDNNIWSSTQQPAFSWLNNDSGNDMKFGKLYNNYAACCNICPEGWRVPGFDDYRNLIAAIGEESAGKIRSAKGWTTPIRPSTNEYGLDVLPSGYRSGDTGNFEDGEIAILWWNKKDYLQIPEHIIVDAQYNSVRTGFTKNLRYGYSVRCVRD